jgi:DNA (cytosine-5)-methyltransferase 1
VADALAIGRAGGADNQGQESAERNGFTASSLADSDGGRCEQRDQRERGLPVSDARRETPDTASPRSPQRSDEEELRQQPTIERAGVVPDSAGRDRGRGDDRRDRGVEGDGASRIFGSGQSLRTYADECWEWWATEPDVGRVAHGVPHRVDRLKALGNAVVPQVAAYIGRRILEAFALG